MNDLPHHPSAVFRPEVFDVQTLKDAMRIIVTPERGTTTEERWEKETPYLVTDIGTHLGVAPEMCVLDFGCGVGRVAKGLIDRFGCRVVGVDFSPSMRLLAPEYVLSERFTVWSPDVLEKMIAKGFCADAAICLWVLQHVLNPVETMELIYRTLTPGRQLYTLNMHRCVPTDRGWADDGFDLRSGLCQIFEEQHHHSLPVSVTTPRIAEMSIIQVLRIPPGGR
jgi:ubiquinone/menaquinone biosynthesis C-methylase UbiE